MNIDRLFAVSGSALDAQRQRLNIIASNLANAESTQSPQGGPYKRRDVVFQAGNTDSPFQQVFHQAFSNTAEPSGVHVAKVVVDQRPPRKVHDPHHPNADEQGYVAMPNINVIEEMTNMLTASRSYEANLAVIDTAKTMALRALEMGR